jgi:hypothetical protein
MEPDKRLRKRRNSGEGRTEASDNERGLFGAALA